MKRTNMTNLAVETEANAFARLMDDGFIDIYSGPQPATADTPLNGQVMAVSLSFSKPAFAPSLAGELIANSIRGGEAENSVELATWARIYRADHKTPVMDVTVGTRDAVVVLPTVNIQARITVTCSHFSHTIPKFGEQ